MQTVGVEFESTSRLTPTDYFQDSGDHQFPDPPIYFYNLPTQETYKNLKCLAK